MGGPEGRALESTMSLSLTFCLSMNARGAFRTYNLLICLSSQAMEWTLG